jgi:hypothetical protein
LRVVPLPLVLERLLAFYRPAFDKIGDGVVASYGNTPQASVELLLRARGEPRSALHYGQHNGCQETQPLSLITVELTFAMENSSKPSFSFSEEYHNVASRSIYFFM